MPVPVFDEIPGKWTYFYEEAMRIARGGHQVIVITPFAGQQYQGPEDIRVYRCPSVYPVPRASSPPAVNVLGVVSVLRRVFHNEKPIDVIYDSASGFLPISIACRLWSRMKGIKIPIIIHVHGRLEDLRSRSVLRILFELYLHTVARISYRIADKVLITSMDVYPRVISLGAEPGKIAVVHLGTRYGEVDGLRDEHGIRILRKELGLSEGSFVIGFVGRPSQGKGVDGLLKAYAIAKPEMLDAKLIIIGESSERLRMQQLCDGLRISEDVRFLGWRDDVPKLLSVMNVFVNLSQSEGWVPAAQIEAMQMGLPSVVTPFSNSISSMKEAIVVQQGDIQAAAEAMVRLHDDAELRETLGRNAIATAKELQKQCSWDDYLSKLNLILDEVRGS
jgi:glycosyltransferase involved in cell wall biosynthesis